MRSPQIPNNQNRLILILSPHPILPRNAQFPNSFRILVAQPVYESKTFEAKPAAEPEYEMRQVPIYHRRPFFV